MSGPVFWLNKDVKTLIINWKNAKIQDEISTERKRDSCIEKLLHYSHMFENGVIFATSLDQASDQDSNQDPNRDQDPLLQTQPCIAIVIVVTEWRSQSSKIFAGLTGYYIYAH